MAEKLSPITPSEILRYEFMEPLNLTNIKLAEALNLPLSHIDAILNGNQPINSELALRLSRCFGNSAEFWLNLQQRYNLKIARQINSEERLAERRRTAKRISKISLDQ